MLHKVCILIDRVWFVVGGGFTSATSRNVPICEYTERDDKRPSIIHYATSKVRCGTYTHPEPACCWQRRSCRSLIFCLIVLFNICNFHSTCHIRTIQKASNFSSYIIPSHIFIYSIHKFVLI